MILLTAKGEKINYNGEREAHAMHDYLIRQHTMHYEGFIQYMWKHYNTLTQALVFVLVIILLWVVHSVCEENRRLKRAMENVPVRLQKPLSMALRAVVHASKLTQKLQGQVKALTKPDSSPVTVVDLAVQTLITMYLQRKKAHLGPKFRMLAEEDASNEQIFEGVASELNKRDAGPEGKRPRSRFPFAEVGLEGGILAEDVQSALAAANDAGGPKGCFWVLDPIDGTKGFVDGRQYTIGLGLVEDGEPVLSIVACPKLGEERLERSSMDDGMLFAAIQGVGAFSCTLVNARAILNMKSKSRRRAMPEIFNIMKPIKVAATDNNSPTSAVMCESYAPKNPKQKKTCKYIRETLTMDKQPIRVHSAHLKYCLVARGDAHVYYRPDKGKGGEYIWDHAPAALLVTEAGGRVTDLDGAEINWTAGRRLSKNRGFLATNGGLHELAQNVIAHVEAKES